MTDAQPSCSKNWDLIPRVTAGFTLIEVMITIAILSFLLSIGVLGMAPVITQKQVSTTLASLRADVVFSRGEAIKRGGWIGLCGSEDGTSCSASIQNGWLVYHDANRDSALDSTDTVLSWTLQENDSLVVELEEIGTFSSDILTFNHRGYPDRSILLRISKGDLIKEMILQTTGVVKSE